MTGPKAAPGVWTAPVFGLELVGMDRRETKRGELIFTVPLDDGDFAPIEVAGGVIATTVNRRTP